MLLLLALTGCERNPVEEYGNTLINSYERSQKAGDEATLSAMNRSVQAFRAMNGRYPDGMDEVERMMGTPVDRERYVYDPERGEVRFRE